MHQHCVPEEDGRESSGTRVHVASGCPCAALVGAALVGAALAGAGRTGLLTR